MFPASSWPTSRPFKRVNSEVPTVAPFHQVKIAMGARLPWNRAGRKARTSTFRSERLIGPADAVAGRNPECRRPASGNLKDRGDGLAR